MAATTLTGQRYSRMLVPVAFSRKKSFSSSLPDLAKEKNPQRVEFDFQADDECINSSCAILWAHWTFAQNLLSVDLRFKFNCCLASFLMTQAASSELGDCNRCSNSVKGSSSEVRDLIEQDRATRVWIWITLPPKNTVLIACSPMQYIYCFPV